MLEKKQGSHSKGKEREIKSTNDKEEAFVTANMGYQALAKDSCNTPAGKPHSEKSVILHAFVVLHYF